MRITAAVAFAIGVLSFAAPATATPLVPGALLFTSYRDGTAKLYAVNFDGTDLRQLPPEPAGIWAPDGRSTADVVYHDGTRADIVIRSAADGSARMLPTGGDAKNFGWSPDGRRIVYSGRSSWGLWIADVASGRVAELLRQPADYPVWSPDGSRIAYSRPEGLFVTDVRGRHQQRVWWSVDGSSVSWEPNGKRLVFVERVGRKASVYVARADGRRQPHPILTDVSVKAAWSPVGAQIAVTGQIGDVRGVWVIRPDGSGLRQLFSGTVYGRALWSPEGTQLAFDSGSDIWVADTSGASLQRVTEGERYGYFNSLERWQPEGLWTSSLGGTRVTPAIPTDSVVAPRLLKTVHPIRTLAADGASVAVAYTRGPYCLEVWNPLAGSVARFGVYGCGPSAFAGLALSGERVAWVEFRHFAGLDLFDLFTATASAPALVYVGDVCPRTPDCLKPELDPVAAGPLLVFDTWTESCAYPRFPQPCAMAPKSNGELWRLDGNRTTRIAAAPGGLTPLAVDEGRIVVDEGGGTLALLQADGTPIRSVSVAGAVVGAKLGGSDLVVQTPDGLVDYDAGSGAVRHTWPLAAANARLEGVATGIAVYSAGSDVHLVRLADGREAVIHADGAVESRLTEAGLFYAYTTADADYPGRVAFVPFAALLEQLA